jgi:hypothetical protein
MLKIICKAFDREILSDSVAHGLSSMCFYRCRFKYGLLSYVLYVFGETHTRHNDLIFCHSYKLANGDSHGSRERSGSGEGVLFFLSFFLGGGGGVDEI